MAKSKAKPVANIATLKDFCNIVEKSVKFYKTDFFFVKREGNKKTLLFVQRSLPGMRMRVVNNNVEIETTYGKDVPTKERNRPRRTPSPSAFAVMSIGRDGDPVWEDGDEEIAISPRSGWNEDAGYKSRVLAHTFAKLEGVRMATLFDYGFEFICDQGIDLYAAESASLEDSSAGNIISMCGKPIRVLPLRSNISRTVLTSWTRATADDDFFEKLRQNQVEERHIPMGQHRRKIDVTDMEIV
jgi:hypothetical protein